MVFEGATEPDGGELRPDESRSGLGLEPCATVLEEHRIE
jgi:hypothetical protein